MTPEELRRIRVGAFHRLAAEELDAARLLATSHPAQAAYFLQQSVEKLARGVLEMLDVPVGPTHNIHQLALLMAGQDAWRDRFAALDELSVAATRYRYPGPKGTLGAMPLDRLVRLLDGVGRLNEEFGAILLAFANND
ncbi:HEPN domain-containing protein [Oryzibacter oryziterrae]|uniref:HEPN domain-containing protein n=1 Tax=Oryzibacter oryziterrae TaxID=2766474 RepID=UPI001F28C8D7|nr:HEPN domain-containing protein [Oryzibacter oryziterrae]